MGPLSRAALALLLLAGRAAAADREIVQLHGVFPDDAVRDQGKYGACHSFASVALLENALRRAGAGDRRLSEADLFLRYTLTSDRYIELMGQVGFDNALKESALKERARYVREGADPAPELAHALKEGVASLESVPWSATIRYYEFYVTNLQALLDARIAECQKGVACTRSLASRSAYHNYASYVRYLRDGNKNPGPLMIPGEPAKLQTEREETRKLLSSFKIKAAYGHNDTVMPDENCRQRGLAVREAVAAAVRAHRPVLIGMKLDNLVEWNNQAGGHAFLITGFLRDGDRYTFMTRNSWGGRNPDVPDDRLCHVSQALWLE